MINWHDIKDWENDYIPLDVVKRPEDESNPVVGRCPKCGIELRRMMWYCCMENECPTQVKPRL
jgi:NAD-dependent DNA ligase